MFPACRDRTNVNPLRVNFICVVENGLRETSSLSSFIVVDTSMDVVVDGRHD